jgi:hypothetical protein
MLRFLDILAALMTMIMFWLMGNKKLAGPIFGILTQVVWIIYATMLESWAMLIVSIIIMVIHIRNIILWSHAGVHIHY